MGTLRIRCCYLDCLPSYPVDVRLEMHGFLDGSSKAYTAIVYIRVHWQDQISMALAASKTRLCFDELRTAVSEVEAIVNSRPLIHIPSEPELILTDRRHCPSQLVFEA